MLTEDPEYILRSFLKKELHRRKNSNSNYSLRAFARDLAIDNSSLSKIMNGKKKVGEKFISKIFARFNYSDDEISSILKGDDSVFQKYDAIPSQYDEIIADWKHYALLELIKLEDFTPKTAWIAKKLNCTEIEVEEVLNRLKVSGMLTINQAGEWIDHTSGMTTHLKTGFTTEAMRKNQKDILFMSMEAIDRVPLEKRSHSSMTFAIDENNLEEAREVIKQFRRKMDLLLTKGGKLNQVYHLAVSLYPVTDLDNKNTQENNYVQ